MRSVRLNKYSPLAILAGFIVKLFGIANKATDQAPKRFAARMGLGFTIVILAFIILQLPIIAVVLTITLCFFALLESAFSICVGCYVYSYYHKLLNIKTVQ